MPVKYVKGAKVAPFWSSYSWVKSLIEANPIEMPERLASMVKEELTACGKSIPRLTIKNVESFDHDYLGGYTLHKDEGEICVVYGNGQWEDTINERNTLLHELAHWIVGPEYHSTDGHTPKFYAELTRLVLRYGVDLDHFIADEYNYTGNKVFEGISLFHSIYNEGKKPSLIKRLLHVG